MFDHNSCNDLGRYFGGNRYRSNFTINLHYGKPRFLTVYPKVTKYAGIFGIMTHIQFIITATFLLLILYIIKNIYLAWQNKIQIDFAIQNQIYYSEELLTEYLQNRIFII